MLPKNISYTIWKNAGALLVALFLILVIILDAQESSRVFESPLLLALLNTVFLGVIPLGMAYLAAKSHQSTGSFGFLLAGCGLVFFGISSLYAGWVMPLAGGPNPTVTLHNLGSLLAGLCQLLAAHFFLQDVTGVEGSRPRIPGYKMLYAGILGLVSLTAILVYQGRLPVFFDPLTGAGPLRQLVLGSAIFLFAVAGWVFIEIYVTAKTEFARWYGLGLWLIAIGLSGVFLQHGVGSPLGWAGRAAQYIGSTYLVIAFLQGRWERVHTGPVTTIHSTWVFWPYLEHKISERTTALTQKNITLQNELIEHTRQEEALRESEASLKFSQRVAHVGNWTWDTASNRVTWSDEMYRIFGLNPETFDGDMAKIIADAIHPEDRKKVNASNHAVLTEKKPAPLEYRVIWPDQSVHTVWAEAYEKIVGVDGKIIKLGGIVQDITEHKQVEAALQKNEQNLRILFDTMSEGIALNENIYDENGEMVDYRILSVNQAFYAIADYQGVEVIGGLATQLYGMSAEFIRDFWKQHREKKTTAYTEMNSPLGNRDFFVATSPFVNDCFVTSFFDITERKQAENMFRARLRLTEFAISNPLEPLLQKVIDELCALAGSPIGFFHYVDQDERTLSLQAWSTYTLAKMCTTEGRGHHYDVDQAGVWADCVRQRQPVIHNDYASLPSCKGMPAGHALVIREMVLPIIRNQKIVAIIGVGNKPQNYTEADVAYLSKLADLAWDIVERKRVEGALRESEERYRSLFDSMTEGCALHELVFDENGQACDYRFLDINPAFEHLTGLKREDLIGKTQRQVIPSEDPFWFETYRKVALTGESTHIDHYSAPLQRHYEVYAYCPAPKQFAVVFMDITERKRVEEKTKKSLTEKETLLRELYHRTKNNMAVIIALLGLQAEAFADEHLRQAFVEAQNRVHSMALVHQKLYDAKDLSLINLKEYIDDLVLLLMRSYNVSPVSIPVIPEMEDVFVLIDSAIPCGLILNELLSNTLKYAFPSGRAGEIRIQLHKAPGGEIHLRLADNGVGVPPDFDFRRDGHLGLQTVFLLGEGQLQGQVLFDTQQGVTCQLKFHDIYYEPRV